MAVSAGRWRLQGLRLWAMIAILLTFALGAGAQNAVAAHARRGPSHATVLEVQRLFGILGYPLGKERNGVYGFEMKGALHYFQTTHGLPATGYPDAKTLTRMRHAATVLRKEVGPGISAASDVVERALGRNPPVLPVAIGLALLLALLAVGAVRLGPQRSRSSETFEPIDVSPEET
jgi:hypothetical protein